MPRGHEFESRVIVGGPPRSGTTLLRFLLDATDAIISGPETAFFLRAMSQQERRTDRMAARLDRALGLGEARIESVLASARDLVPAFDELMAMYAEQTGREARVWAEKTPRNCLRYFELALENPTLRFISLVRDGRDVVTSRMEGHEGYYATIQDYVDCMRGVLGFDAAAGSLPGSPRHLLIRYEDLVGEPETVMERVCGFIGVPYGPEVLTRYLEESPTRDRTKVRQPKLDRPISTEWVCRWRRPEHAARVAEFMSDERAVALLTASGYELEPAGVPATE